AQVLTDRGLGSHGEDSWQPVWHGRCGMDGGETEGITVCLDVARPVWDHVDGGERGLRYAWCGAASAGAAELSLREESWTEAGQ
ncbi:hypothetical protein BaRGS_00032329, partial [Batillaria attramentaria]